MGSSCGEDKRWEEAGLGRWQWDSRIEESGKGPEVGVMKDTRVVLVLFTMDRSLCYCVSTRAWLVSGLLERRLLSGVFPLKGGRVVAREIVGWARKKPMTKEPGKLTEKVMVSLRS